MSTVAVWACTSAIITGKLTKDGRPLMWKHRDSGAGWNHIAYFKGERFCYTGLVNSENPSDEIWTGMNEAGFAIMNTASYNLKDDEVEEMDKEGRFMKRALEICKDMKDFEYFLDTLSRPMGVEANFGVIDAFGGAAYYETNNHTYVKMDVNDEELAPRGYLIYTNFSFHGRKDEGKGYIRYDTAEELFGQFEKEDFTAAHLFAGCSRSFRHSLLGIDLREEAFSPNRASGFCVEQDFIPRYESIASVVIQGVKPGMDPELVTLWAVLGYPPVSIALPVWVKMGEEIPALLAASAQTGKAPLCEVAVQLRDFVFSVKRGNGLKYMNWSLLYNAQGSGIMQVLQPAEEAVFALFAPYQTEWERQGLKVEEIRQLYGQATEIIKTAYKQNLGILLQE
ncbi:MAG: hypothetical protein HP000_04635 [Odoribacter sp.]|nr:hypothetical protein [Odoribacter sp.]